MKTLSNEKIINTTKHLSTIKQISLSEGLDPLSNPEYIIKRPESKSFDSSIPKKSE